MCTVALKIDPKNGQALATRGHAKNALGDHHDAVTDCTDVLKINPNSLVSPNYDDLSHTHVYNLY